MNHEKITFFNDCVLWIAGQPASDTLTSWSRWAEQRITELLSA